MVRAGELCAAEDLLYERLDPDDRDGLAAALRFYSALNALPDAELKRGISRAMRSFRGSRTSAGAAGSRDVLHVLPGGEDEPRFDA